MSFSTCPVCGVELKALPCSCPKCGNMVNGVTTTNGIEHIPVPPEIMEWFKQQYSEEEIIAGIEEIERTGGLQLHDFIHELEAEAETRE